MWICACCFCEFDETLSTNESFVTCENVKAHRFCYSCVQSVVANALGNGALDTVRCMCSTEECGAQFSWKSLETALAQYKPLLLRQYQALVQMREHSRKREWQSSQEHQNATYATNQEDNDNNASHSRNSPTNMPEKKQKREDIVRRIENAMTESVLRQCLTCHREFVKHDGCNAIECTSCHRIICYVCNTVLRKSDMLHHFSEEMGFGDRTDNGKCRRFSNSGVDDARKSYQVAQRILDENRTLLSHDEVMRGEIVVQRAYRDWQTAISEHDAREAQRIMMQDMAQMENEWNGVSRGTGSMSGLSGEDGPIHMRMLQRNRALALLLNNALQGMIMENNNADDDSNHERHITGSNMNNVRSSVPLHVVFHAHEEQENGNGDNDGEEEHDERRESEENQGNERVVVVIEDDDDDNDDNDDDDDDNDNDDNDDKDNNDNNDNMKENDNESHNNNK